MRHVNLESAQPELPPEPMKRNRGEMVENVVDFHKENTVETPRFKTSFLGRAPEQSNRYEKIRFFYWKFSSRWPCSVGNQRRVDSSFGRRPISRSGFAWFPTDRQGRDPFWRPFNQKKSLVVCSFTLWNTLSITPRMKEDLLKSVPSSPGGSHWPWYQSHTYVWRSGSS